MTQPAPATYVLVPRGLIEDLRDSPLAIGVYTLVARVYRATRAPVPLSPGDLAIFDPSLTHGSATRALRRLAEAGYLLRTDPGGRKHAYTPTWGLVRQAAVPWDLTATGLGRPRHTAAIKLDDRMLDLLIGRLRPYPSHPAIVERYLLSPLLTLRAVGTYALALIHVASTCPSLKALGLIDAAGHPLPLPDDGTVLAIASQRAADSSLTGGLTPAGWERVGMAPAPSSPSPGQPLFFVPDGQIAQPIRGVIAHTIGSTTRHDSPNAASGSEAAPIHAHAFASHGRTEIHGNHEPPPPRAEHVTAAAGGGQASFPRAKGRTAPDGSPMPAQTMSAQSGRQAVKPAARTSSDPVSSPPDPPTTSDTASNTEGESTRLLREIGVRADVAAQLADRSPDQIRAVLAQARGRQDVRSVAAWVVSALRALPAVAAAAPPRVSEKAILFHPQLSGYDRQRWLALFRAADPADRASVLARFLAAHPQEETDAAAA